MVAIDDNVDTHTQQKQKQLQDVTPLVLLAIRQQHPRTIFGIFTGIKSTVNSLETLKMPPTSYSALEDLWNCVVKVGSRSDLNIAYWLQAIEDEVYSAKLFINEKLPTGDYALLQLQ